MGCSRSYVLENADLITELLSTILTLLVLSLDAAACGEWVNQSFLHHFFTCVHLSRSPWEPGIAPRATVELTELRTTWGIGGGVDSRDSSPLAPLETWSLLSCGQTSRTVKNMSPCLRGCWGLSLAFLRHFQVQVRDSAKLWSPSWHPGRERGEFSSRRTMADSFDLPCVQKLLPFFHVIVHYPESEHLLLNPRRRHLVHVSGHPKLLRMLR